MYVDNINLINTASIHHRGNIIHKVSEEFLELTGYTYDDIIGRSVDELSTLLKTDINIDFKDDKLFYQGYIFTNEDHPKHVEIRSDDLSREDEVIYNFKESPNEFLNGVLATCIDIDKDDRLSEAILSYPELIYLKTDKNYIDEISLFGKDFSNILRSQILGPDNILDNIKKHNYYFEEEKSFVDSLGNPRYITIKAHLIFKEGEARYLKVTLIDETEKVLIRKGIQKQKNEMEIILDHIPASVVKLDKKGEYTYNNQINKERLAKYHLGESALTTKEIFEAFRFNDINGCKLSFDEIPESRVLKVETLKDYIIIITSDLGTSYHKCSGTPIYDDKGDIESAVIVYRDVDEILELEECRALSENLKKLNINYAAISSEAFKVKYANETAVESVMKTDPSIKNLIDIIGKNSFDYYTDDPNEEKEIIDNINLLVKGKHLKYVHKQKFIERGEIVYYKTVFQPLLDEFNQIEQISCVGMNVTDEELDKQELTDSLKAQDEVFVNTSHELKTPINLIFSASQMLNIHLDSGCNDSACNNCKKDSIARNNKIITQNCYRSIKLIDNILDVSKIENGFCKLSLKSKNIVNVVDNMVMSVSDYIKDKNLSIIFDPKVEEKIMGVDLYKFERIMLNLISNAIKFSNDGDVIFIDLIDHDTSVEISIKDQGIGIDSKNLESIFNKFKQEDKSLNRNVEGTGVGLYLVKSMIDLHGGSIDVESTLNVGTKFTINLPVEIIEETIVVEDDYREEDRVDMIKFELSDIYD